MLKKGGSSKFQKHFQYFWVSSQLCTAVISSNAWNSKEWFWGLDYIFLLLHILHSHVTGKW